MRECLRMRQNVTQEEAQGLPLACPEVHHRHDGRSG